MNRVITGLFAAAVLSLSHAVGAQEMVLRVNPARMPQVGTVSERFQSYNIEMAEITGGRFWKPYDQAAPVPATQPASGNQPAGIDPNLFQYRPPIDLTNAKLRTLASALGPAYVRVSGTWQNSTYFAESDVAPPSAPPAGFNGVLTRAEWKGVIDFAKAVHAEIVTSVATSAGTRDAQGLWTGTQARSFFDFTRQAGGTIAATEFMNEPTFAQIGGAPKGYDGAAFGRDVAVFRTFLRKTSPGTIFLGPGSVGEGIPLSSGIAIPLLPSPELLKGSGPVFDAFSYHFYGGVSARCKGGLKAEDALSPEWLDRTDVVESFYQSLRDQFLPGKPIWLTETGEAACGGDRWASTFLDSFRYLNQLGTLAKRGVQVVAHNTLAASDYALLEPETFDPRPNYWAAVLWHRLMGTTVLDAGKSASAAVYMYAHCLQGVPGGVALLALNTGDVPVNAEVPNARRFSLTAQTLDSKQVLLNGTPLVLNADGMVPTMDGAPAGPGPAKLPAHSITFFAVQNAGNAGCRA